MSKSNAWENSLLLLYFNATGSANVTANAASPITNLYVALYTTDPGEAGTATTNEIAYTNYARVAVARSAVGWNVTNNTVINNSTVTFPACGATAGSANYWATVDTASGAGTIGYSGSCPLLIITNGITPSFSASALNITED